MAAGEDQAQPFVTHGFLPGWFFARVQQRGLGVPVVAGRLPAEPVDGPAAGRGDDPSRRAGRQPGFRPALHRDRERVLDRFLGDVDVPEVADQDRHGAAVFLAEHPPDLGGGDGRHGRRQPRLGSRNGRTSIGSPVTSVILRPQPSAASRSSALRIQKPPRYSFASANGPSVVTT